MQGNRLAVLIDADNAQATVLGFGEKKTPEAFRNACHKFVFTEVLRASTSCLSHLGLNSARHLGKVRALG